MLTGHHRDTNGFSLVELSIVLVILGLLVGGILAGKSLIHASELRKIGADITSYRAASFAFRDKYFYIPGDLPNASSIWPTAYGGYGNGVLGLEPGRDQFLEPSAAGWHDLRQYRSCQCTGYPSIYRHPCTALPAGGVWL